MVITRKGIVARERTRVSHPSMAVRRRTRWSTTMGRARRSSVYASRTSSVQRSACSGCRTRGVVQLREYLHNLNNAPVGSEHDTPSTRAPASGNCGPYHQSQIGFGARVCLGKVLTVIGPGPQGSRDVVDTSRASGVVPIWRAYVARLAPRHALTLHRPRHRYRLGLPRFADCGRRTWLHADADVLQIAFRLAQLRCSSLIATVQAPLWATRPAGGRVAWHHSLRRRQRPEVPYRAHDAGGAHGCGLATSYCTLSVGSAR